MPLAIPSRSFWSPKFLFAGPRRRDPFTSQRLRFPTGERMRTDAAMDDCCCYTCDDFPDCLEGKQLSLTISGVEGSLNHSAPHDPCCETLFLNLDDYEITHSNLISTYLLDYVGGGVFKIDFNPSHGALPTCDVAIVGELRSDAKLIYKVETTACGGDCDGEITSMREVYVSAINATVTCANDEMSVAVTVDVRAAIRSAAAECGLNDWCTGTAGGNARELIFCGNNPEDDVAAPVCSSETMVEGRAGRNFSVSGSCNSTTAACDADILCSARLVL